MKSFGKLYLLLVACTSLVACSQSESSFNSDSKESSILTSSIESLSSEQSPATSFSIPEREEGISLDAFTEVVNGLENLTEKAFRMTFQIKETLIGTYPIYKRNSLDLLEEGVYNTTLVIESSDGSANKTKIVGDRPNTTNNAEVYNNGTTYDLKGWLSYHKQRRGFLDYAQEGEGFKETFSLNPYKMWMVSWGNRPSNSSVEGTYFAFEEHERTFDEVGYCKTIYLRDYRYVDGTFSRWDTKPKEYHGCYDMVVTGTIEYPDPE